MTYVYKEGDLTYTPREMQEGYRELLDPYPFTHWLVLTFRHPPKEEKAKILYRKFINGRQRRHRDPIQWVFTFEGKFYKHLHIHALWMTDAEIDLQAAKKTWRRFNGTLWIEPYDLSNPKRNSYILKESQELDFSDNFGKVPLRRSPFPIGNQLYVPIGS